MRVLSGWRCARPALWARAALCVVLAALIHVLGCAHGPAPAGTERSDAILTVAATCEQATNSAHGAALGSAGHHHGGFSACSGVDEPSIQAPRDIGAPQQPAVALQPFFDAATLVIAPATTEPPPGGESGGAPHGRTQALLGVWQN